jgi:hypothetical protein
MSRKTYVFRDGKLHEIGNSSSESRSAAVHQDTLPRALRHPVTGEITESAHRMKQITRELGMETVGDDLQSGKKQVLPELVKEERIIDAQRKAEAILSDPARRNEYRNRELEKREYWERNERLRKAGGY